MGLEIKSGARNSHPTSGGHHGHTGPTTPAEDASREADPALVPDQDKSDIAQEASRQEDA